MKIGSKTYLTKEWKWIISIGRYSSFRFDRNIFGWYQIVIGVWLSRGEEGVVYGGKEKGIIIDFCFWLPFYF